MEKDLSIYYENAVNLKLPVRYHSELNCLQITLGKKYLFLPYITPFNSSTSIYLARNKHTLNKLLTNKGFPMPKAVTIHRENFTQPLLDQFIQDLHFPLVIKPTVDTFGGRDVVCNIKNIESLLEYLVLSFKKYPSMQIEEFHQGLKEYRVLMLKNRVLGVVERLPPSMVGDDEHTLEQLIAIHNQEPTNSTKARLKIDEDCKNCLKDQGFTLYSIPKKGDIVQLCYAVNRARGGQVISLLDKIHSDNAKYLYQASKIIGLDFVGFDILCDDIHKSFNQTSWIILEANFGPDITLHEFPDVGEKQCVSKKILWHLIFRHPLAYLLCRIRRFKTPDTAMKGKPNG